MRARTKIAGFTLLEAMVALVIVALGMMAVSTQLNRYVVSTAFIERKALASWIASNILTDLSVAPQWPPLGETEGEVTFAQRQWIWRAEVLETAVENLRRVDVTVFLVSADQPELQVHTLSGLLEPPPPRGFVPLSWLSVGMGAGGMGAGG